MTKTQFFFALRLLLTVAFLYFGIRKLISFETDVAIYQAIGFGQFPRYITGSVEVFGAALLWLRGWQGVAGLLLLITMLIGTTALLLWVGPPYWHMALLILGTGSVVWHYRAQVQNRVRWL